MSETDGEKKGRVSILASLTSLVASMIAGNKQVALRSKLIDVTNADVFVLQEGPTNERRVHSDLRGSMRNHPPQYARASL